MTKNCRIMITDLQNESIIKADARFHMKDGCRYVFFDQSAQDAAVPCSLKFNEDGLHYSRKGEFAAELDISRAEKTAAEYATPSGTARAAVETKLYRLEDTEYVIRIEIEYLLSFDDINAERLRMLISIEKTEEV